MIAPKPKRNYARSQGNNGQAGKGNGKNDQNGKGKSNDMQNGSSYVNLANSTEEDDQTGEAETSVQAENDNRAQGPKSMGLSKGKRPIAQLSEKQINGNNMHGKHRVQTEVGESSTKRKTSKNHTGKQANQAGAA